MDPKIEDIEDWVPPPLDVPNLELVNFFFNIIMISNAQVGMSLHTTENPMSRLLTKALWQRLHISEALRVHQNC